MRPTFFVRRLFSAEAATSHRSSNGTVRSRNASPLTPHHHGNKTLSSCSLESRYATATLQTAPLTDDAAKHSVRHGEDHRRCSGPRRLLQQSSVQSIHPSARSSSDLRRRDQLVVRFGPISRRANEAGASPKDDGGWPLPRVTSKDSESTALGDDSRLCINGDRGAAAFLGENRSDARGRRRPGAMS